MADASGLVGGHNADKRVTILGEDPRGRLGSALVVVDLDLDGAVDLVVGAPGTNTLDVNESVQAGTVYVFAGGGAWAGSVPLSAAAAALAAPRQYLRAGERLAVGDLDDDGLPELAVLTREADPATAVQ